MDENKLLALEFTKAFIQNVNVKPAYYHSHNDTDGISYVSGDVCYTFNEITNHFYENIKRIERWDV
ncbi:hypothetical protein [Paenisporosarcina sp. TG20]|uniref:hypothetical protein n=1 Tax=Paenisporosarcina sp. TG20 TaxID=1211706 RepID=UPI0002E0C340|nr:hypothetical protein [Paenisporosarcina sp. TG20]